MSDDEKLVSAWKPHDMKGNVVDAGTRGAGTPPVRHPAKTPP
jgi:hypothetical protein